jgi:hypothetical protein
MLLPDLAFYIFNFALNDGASRTVAASRKNAAILKTIGSGGGESLSSLTSNSKLNIHYLRSFRFSAFRLPTSAFANLFSLTSLKKTNKWAYNRHEAFR